MTSRGPSIVLSVTALALAGCGEDEPAATSAAALSDAEFARQADAICEEVNRENPPPQQPDDSAEAVEIETRELEIVRDLDARLGELEPPSEAAATFEEYRATTAEAQATSEELIAAAEAGDEERFRELDAERGDILEERGELGEELGFEVCGQLQVFQTGEG